jgi:hypothetical protein
MYRPSRWAHLGPSVLRRCAFKRESSAAPTSNPGNELGDFLAEFEITTCACAREGRPLRRGRGRLLCCSAALGDGRSAVSAARAKRTHFFHDSAPQNEANASQHAATPFSDSASGTSEARSPTVGNLCKRIRTWQFPHFQITLIEIVM